jgi:hypothetical protein
MSSPTSGRAGRAGNAANAPDAADAPEAGATGDPEHPDRAGHAACEGHTGKAGGSARRPPLLKRISAQQWLALDVALGLLLFVGGLTHVIGHRHAGSSYPLALLALLALLLAGASLPTMFLRRYPLTA